MARSKTTLPIQQRIRQVVERWFVTEPLLFSIWTTHALAAEPRIRTIRVRRTRIEYNPAFLNSLESSELEEVLRYEATRILLKHPYQRRKENAQFAYLASNITLQEYLRTSLPHPRAQEVFGTNEHNHKYFEYYYQSLQTWDDEKANAPSLDSDLPDDDDSQPDDDNGNGASDDRNDSADQLDPDADSENHPDPSADSDANEPVNNEEGDPEGQEADADHDDKNSRNDPEDNHGDVTEDSRSDRSSPKRQSMPGNSSPTPSPLEEYADADARGRENTEDWDGDELTADRINSAIRTAHETDRWGSVAGYLRERVMASLRPKLDYRTILRQFRTTILASSRALTRMKPSRRYGFAYMGSRYDFTTNLLFAIDVSGSIGPDDLKRGFSVINRFFKYGIQTIDVIQFDVEIHGAPTTLKRARYEVDAVGGGGTDFAPVMAYIDTHRAYDGLIIFTDGIAPVPPLPNNRRTRVLWLFNNESTYATISPRLSHIGKAAFLKQDV